MRRCPPNAIRFYQRMGFRRAGQVDGYWSDGSPMLVFLRELEAAS